MRSSLVSVRACVCAHLCLPTTPIALLNGCSRNKYETCLVKVVLHDKTQISYVLRTETIEHILFKARNIAYVG